MGNLLVIHNFEWVDERNAFIVFLLMALGVLIRWILMQAKSIKSKDKIILEIAMSSIAAVEVAKDRARTNTIEHKELKQGQSTATLERAKIIKSIEILLDRGN